MQQRRFRVQPERVPVNWRRGMFRLWVVVSSAWVMGWLIFFAIKFVSGEYNGQQAPVLPVVLLGPPFALLLFGLGARWAMQGFEVDEDKDKEAASHTPANQSETPR